MKFLKHFRRIINIYPTTIRKSSSPRWVRKPFMIVGNKLGRTCPAGATGETVMEHLRTLDTFHNMAKAHDVSSLLAAQGSTALLAVSALAGASLEQTAAFVLGYVGATLASGASCVITLAFAPTAAGNAAATLTVSSDAGTATAARSMRFTKLV